MNYVWIFVIEIVVIVVILLLFGNELKTISARRVECQISCEEKGFEFVDYKPRGYEKEGFSPEKCFCFNVQKNESVRI